MRILSVSNCPLNPEQGSGYVICGYAERMRALGHEVTLAGPEAYVPFKSLSSALRLRMLFGYTRAVLSGVRRTQPQVVELWGGEAWLAAKLLRRRQRRPLVVARSNGIEPHASECMARMPSVAAPSGAGASRRSFAGGLLDRMQDMRAAFTHVDALTTVGQFDADWALSQKLQPESRVLALDNPLDDSWLGLTWSPNRHPVAGFTGSWIERKGVSVLREALPLILACDPNVSILLVGVGEQFDAAKELPNIPANRLRVVGRAGRKDLPSLYGYMSVLLMPSWYESFGLVAAEAMACGTPVVATHTGFASSWKDGREGWLVPFGDPSALATAVVEGIRNQAIRTEVAQRAWRRAQMLRWSDAAQKLEQFYKAQLGPEGGGTGR